MRDQDADDSRRAAARALRIGWITAVAAGLLSGGMYWRGLTDPPDDFERRIIVCITYAGIIGVTAPAIFVMCRSSRKQGGALLIGGLLLMAGLAFSLMLVANIIGYFRAGS